jgi:hypothetical protein
MRADRDRIDADDVRSDFATRSEATPRDRDARAVFADAKIHLARTHPRLRREERDAAADALRALLRRDSIPDAFVTPPAPGGVGYGVFYDDAFKAAFASGTSLAWDIICPAAPGGNVNTWLYLTAMNRAAMGIEAFVMYHGTDEPKFQIFDWARTASNPWQTNILFSQLSQYIQQKTAHGQPYQVISVQNMTLEDPPGSGLWSNRAYLWNNRTGSYDYVYGYEYGATLADQIGSDQTGRFRGSWAPIVETFQDAYQSTNPMGGMSAYLMTRDAGGSWGPWQLLDNTISAVRADNKGFQLAFLDPNYAFAVTS